MRTSRGGTVASTGRRDHGQARRADAAPPHLTADRGTVVSLEGLLRSRGLSAGADRWARRIAQTDRAMQGLQPAARSRLAGASRELTATRRLAEAQIAPALDVRIGFSDSDGD